MNAMSEKSEAGPIIQLAILEDNSNMLLGLRAQFDRPDFHICVATDNSIEFLTSIEASIPDVAILDLRLWSELEAGFKGLETVRATSPRTRCIIYTQYDSLANFDRALQLGAKAFIRKEHDVKPEVSLIEIVKIVAAGGSYYDPALFQQYLEVTSNAQGHPDLVTQTTEASRLTKRELQVLRLFSQGLDYSTIAEELVISVHTVKAHTRSIREKLDAHTTEDAVRIATLHSLI